MLKTLLPHKIKIWLKKDENKKSGYNRDHRYMTYLSMHVYIYLRVYLYLHIVKTWGSSLWANKIKKKFFLSEVM